MGHCKVIIGAVKVNRLIEILAVPVFDALFKADEAGVSGSCALSTRLQPTLGLLRPRWAWGFFRRQSPYEQVENDSAAV
jgi:hypothetical protein